MEPYWSYEDIGVFLFVLVFLAAAVGLSVRVLFLRPSELVTPSPALQNFVIIFLSVSLYLILKWRHHGGDCAFGMGGPECLLQHCRIVCRHSVGSLHRVPCPPPPSSSAVYSGS